MTIKKLKEILNLLDLIPVESNGCYNYRLDDRIQQIVGFIESEIAKLEEEEVV